MNTLVSPPSEKQYPRPRWATETDGWQPDDPATWCRNNVARFGPWEVSAMEWFNSDGYSMDDPRLGLQTDDHEDLTLAQIDDSAALDFAQACQCLRQATALQSLNQWEGLQR